MIGQLLSMPLETSMVQKFVGLGLAAAAGHTQRRAAIYILAAFQDLLERVTDMIRAVLQVSALLIFIEMLDFPKLHCCICQ